VESITEKQIEDVLQHNPDIIEDGLIFLDRQVPLGNRRIDLMFSDKDSQILVVELKKGEIQRKDIGQIIEYMGYFLERKNELKHDTSIRTMLIGSKVPDQIQLSLNYFGVEWKELDKDIIRQHIDLLPLPEKKDLVMPETTDQELPEITTIIKSLFNEEARTVNYKWALPLAKIGEQFKEHYPNLTRMSRLPKKGPNVKILTAQSHVHFEWYIRGPSREKVLETGIHIERGKNIEWNNEMLNKFRIYECEFEEILGEKVFYGPHHDTGVPRKYATRISVERTFKNIDEDLMNWAVNTMRKFYDFFNPIILRLLVEDG